MGTKRYHITKRGKGWAVKREGAKRAAKVFGDKYSATESAQKYRAKGIDVIVHKEDGSVETWQKRK